MPIDNGEHAAIGCDGDDGAQPIKDMGVFISYAHQV
jgi:hypothetical protein